MKFCTCASPDSPVEAPRPSFPDCDESNKASLAPRRLVRKPSKLQITMEVTRCRFGKTSHQIAPIGCEDFAPQKDWAPIFHAVYNDREAALRHFLQTGVSPDVTDSRGTPLICIATACGHFEITNMLLDAGVPVSTASKEKGETALHTAIKSGRHSIIDLLLAHRVDLEAKTTHTGETALHYAASGSSSLALVMKLLKFGAKYDVQNSEGRTPAAVALQAFNLHAAVAIINMARGKPKELAEEKDMLLLHVEQTKAHSSVTNDLIADVFAATCDPDSTVLVEAIKKNDSRLVEMFLEKGADPHRATAQGVLPIVVAVEFADLSIIKMLVQHNADITVTSQGSLNLLQVLLETSLRSEETRIYAITDYLLTKGVDGLALCPDGSTLLHRTISTGIDYAKIVKLLLRNRVKVNARDGNGNTALHLAASHGLIHTTSVLLGMHADSTVVDSDKRTPLLCAVHRQQWSVVPLLAIPPAITSWDAEGSTALHHIARTIPKHHTTWRDIAAVAKLFCGRGICRSMRDRSGATPLIQAVKGLPEEGLPVVEILLGEGGEIRNCVGHEDHRRRDALYYAATLGKPVFVEALIKHGATFDLEEWTDGKRHFKLPAASKGPILGLLIAGDRLRQAHDFKKPDSSARETIKSDQRASSALSGYRADSETNQKAKPDHSARRGDSSMQHLQVPGHQRKLGARLPGFPTRTSSKQQLSKEAIFQHHRPALHPRILVSSSPVDSGRSQTVLPNRVFDRSAQHADRLRRAPEEVLASQGLQHAASALLPRVSNQQQTAVLPAKASSPPTPEVPFKDSAMTEDRQSPVLMPPTSDSVAAAEPVASVQTTRKAPVEPQLVAAPKTVLHRPGPATIPSTTVLTKPPEITMRVVVDTVKPVTLPKLPSATLDPSTTIKPVQPARVDSGVSLTQNDSAANNLPVLDRSHLTLDSSTTTPKRQSGGELAGWLAISGMLDRL